MGIIFRRIVFFFLFIDNCHIAETRPINSKNLCIYFWKFFTHARTAVEDYSDGPWARRRRKSTATVDVEEQGKTKKKNKKNDVEILSVRVVFNGISFLLNSGTNFPEAVFSFEPILDDV